ncbi:MAG: 3-oxoacyl-ACP synthase III [Planctomycetota bacterium]|nr:3-oxoacyl-ACP synthase III [Planctomycetota bacterium]MDA1212023.1 3-oxoacyl-ACP synthase III [Planctomycetota bacterium]
MRYHHVCVEAIACTLPPEVVTSDELEHQLLPVYERLGLPAGRLELMTGIRERRFFPRGTRPGDISAVTAQKALTASGIEPRDVGALFHGSVCRDQLEPATANAVHHALGISGNAYLADISNACLGLLNGVVQIADMIELGHIRAGIVVGTEDGRGLVEGTIASVLKDEKITRQQFKLDFASLTIGSGSAAIVLCDRQLSRAGHRLLGGAYACDTTSHELCEGGVEFEKHGDDRPRMQTDSEALLHAGINLAGKTWAKTREALNWENADVTKAFTHQVGRAHRKLLFERLELDPAIDFPTVDFLGNTGAAALPTAAALGIEQGHVVKGDRVALLGIGSGLNALMLGIDW